MRIHFQFKRATWTTIKALCIVLLAGVVLGGCRPNKPGPVAYLAVTDGYWQVWLTQSNGGKARQLTEMKADVSRISWYPDGRELLVNLHDGRLFRLAIESGATTAIQAPLPGILDAVISPDGKQAAFSLSTSESIDDNDIWLFDLATGTSEKLTSMPRLQHEPTWSRDGKFVYFLSGAGDQNHDIWRVNVRNRKSEQLTVKSAYHFDLALRGDGALAYSGNRTGSYELWLRHSDGRTEQLTNDPELDARPAWSPNGKQLVFESTRDGALNIWRLDLRSRKLNRVTNTPDGARHPVWAPTGEAQ